MSAKIKDWTEEERPRERLMSFGSGALSNSELLAILLRTGTKNLGVMDLSRTIISKYKLKELYELSFEELSKIKGLGLAKAVTIKAAIELGRRYLSGEKNELLKLNRPELIFEYFHHQLGDYPKERFYTILLDQSNQMIDYCLISEGLINETLVHPREVFQQAIRRYAAKIILMHNHPSGRLEASRADISITEQMLKASEIIGIDVVDHIIISKKGYLSFRNEGLLF